MRQLVVVAAVVFSGSLLRAQENDYEFQSPGGYPLDGASVRLAEGFPGLSAEPGKDRWLEPVDGSGGLDNVAPRLGAEDGPGGLEWDPSPTYRTRYKGATDYPAGAGVRVQGNNWFLRIPYAVDDTYYNARWAVRSDANTFRLLNRDPIYTTIYWGQYANVHSKLVVTGSAPTRTLTLQDTGGKTYTFLESQSFKCTKIVGLGGAEITITYSAGDITVLQKPSATSGSEVRKFVYTIASNRVDKIEISEKNGAAWDLYRKLDFTYHEDVTGPVESSTGDLVGIKEERLLSAASTWLVRRWVNKYWTGTYNASTNPGYPYQVRAVLGPQAVRDFEVANPTLDIYTRTTAQLSSYVDRTYEYEADKRADKLDLKDGCGCGGSEGIYTYAWGVNGTTPSDLNTWSHQVAITYPSANGGKRIVDYNKYGQVLNGLLEEVAGDTGSRRWIGTYRHDTTGRLTDSYSTKASSAYNDSTHVVTTSTSAGRRFLYAYASNHSLSTVKLRDPSSGSEYYQGKLAFTLLTSGDRRRFVLDSATVYPAETTSDTGGKTTSVSYSYHSSDALALKLRTTTLPVVATGENGSGTAVVLKSYFELDGLPTWSKNGDGFVHYTGFDANRRTRILAVRDLNNASRPAGVPAAPDAAFETTSGLNLVEAFEYDSQRRLTKHEGPAFNAWDGTAIVSTKTTERSWYTKLSGGEAVVVEYRHVDSAYFHTALSLSVADYEGRTLTSALGELSAGYRDTTLSDDFDATQSTLAAAFHGTIVQRTDRIYTGDKLTQEQVWSDADDGSAAKFTTTHAYNALGQLEKTTSAAGTITKWTYDVLGRRKSTKLGTVDGGAGDNMTLIEEIFYDDEEDSASNVGDGLVTRSKRYPNQASQVRQTDTTYDYRGRTTQVDEPLGVQRKSTYDNLNRTLVSETWDSASSTRLTKSESFYDSVGQVYESREYEVPLATNKYANTLTWRNGRGLVVKTLSQGKVFQKTQYDGAGRTVNSAVSYDSAETSYADADDLTGDTVMVERRVALDPTGTAELAASYERRHDGTGTGSLTVGSSGNGRAEYAANWFDKLHRPTVAASYGTNGGTDLSSRPTGSPPSASDSTKRVAKSTYTAKSQVETATDPMGIVARTEYFDPGMVSKHIANYHTTPGSDPDDDRTTEYTVDSVGRHWKTTAKASGSDQVTETIWGVVKNTDNSTVSSNDLVYKVKHADTSEVDIVAYNALGETVWTKDPQVTERFFDYDERGRRLHDRATALGSGIDNAILRISTTYDKLDRPLKVSCYDNATVGEGSVKNEVQYEYGPYSTIAKRYQEWAGVVSTSTSKKVEFAWSLPTSGATGIRRTSTTYTDGTVFSDEYNSGTDDTLSRLSGRKLSGVWIVEDKFLGMGRVVEREFGTTTAKWTLLGTDSENQDNYVGLTRFGDIDDLVVKKGTTTIDHFTYSHNYAGQVTLRENLVPSSGDFDESYEYDGLHRLTDHKRGVWSGASMSTIRHHECWTLDRSGNATAYYAGTSSGCTSAIPASFNVSNEITTRNEVPYGYNQPGDMTDRGTLQDQVFNAWGQVVTVTTGSAYLARYRYNGLGEKIARTDSPSLPDVYFYGNGAGQVLEERKISGGTVEKRYVWGTQHIDDLVYSSTGGGATKYYVQDSRYSVITELHYDATVSARWVYDAYGTPKQVSADWSTWQSISEDRNLFTGRLYLKDHGQYDFRARMQDPELGVFVTRDPIGIWGDAGNWGNGYSYVASDPANLVDPTGRRGVVAPMPGAGVVGAWGNAGQAQGAGQLPGLHVGGPPDPRHRRGGPGSPPLVGVPGDCPDWPEVEDDVMAAGVLVPPDLAHFFPQLVDPFLAFEDHPDLWDPRGPRPQPARGVQHAERHVRIALQDPRNRVTERDGCTCVRVPRINPNPFEPSCCPDGNVLCVVYEQGLIVAYAYFDGQVGNTLLECKDWRCVAPAPGVERATRQVRLQSRVARRCGRNYELRVKWPGAFGEGLPGMQDLVGGGIRTCSNEASGECRCR